MNSKSDGVDVTHLVGSALTREERQFRGLMEATLADAMNRKGVYEAKLDETEQYYGARISRLEIERDEIMVEIRRKIDGCEAVAIRCSNTLAAMEGETEPKPRGMTVHDNAVEAALRAAVDTINERADEAQS